jgi:hypothetical protein
LISKYRNKYNKENQKKYRPIIIRRPDIPIIDTNLLSILGAKRNYNDAFKQETYDDIRYGQHIGDGYFTNNMGHSHNVIQENTTFYNEIKKGYVKK